MAIPELVDDYQLTAIAAEAVMDLALLSDEALDAILAQTTYAQVTLSIFEVYGPRLWVVCGWFWQP